LIGCSFVRALRPFLRPGLRVHTRAARRGRQGWPSRLPCYFLMSLRHHICCRPSRTCAFG
jgi:hypothetical protein